MSKKVIILLFILLVVSTVGCNKESGEATDNKDFKIIEWSYSEKEPTNTEKNNANFTGDIISGSQDIMAKKVVNINLKEGQSLRIETETEYPITVMLKDNSNEEYIFNNTAIPVDGAILVDSVKRDSGYELMIDFNEVKEFTFKVYVIN